MRRRPLPSYAMPTVLPAFLLARADEVIE